SFTGTKSVFANDYSQWSGKVRIAVLDSDGKPVQSPNQAMTLDLSNLDTGNGAGKPSTQGIIDEINRYFGPQANTVKLGNLSNFRLASDSTSLPGTPPQFNFDFDLTNMSSSSAKFYVSNVTVQDSTGAAMTAPTINVPKLSVSNYITQAGSNQVTI